MMLIVPVYEALQLISKHVVNSFWAREGGVVTLLPCFSSLLDEKKKKRTYIYIYIFTVLFCDSNTIESRENIICW